MQSTQELTGEMFDASLISNCIIGARVKFILMDMARNEVSKVSRVGARVGPNVNLPYQISSR